MLKFFRRYNKWILVVGASLLMVAFLIQPALSIFMPDPMSQTIGTLGDGTEISRGELINANSDLSLLQDLNPVMWVSLGLDSRNEGGLHWLLAQRDAAALGLSASDGEVLSMLGDSEEAMKRLAQQRGVTVERIHDTVRRWLVFHKYQELMRGVTHMPPATRMGHYQNALQGQMMGNQFYAAYFAMQAQGGGRISKPLLEHSTIEQLATVSGELVLINASSRVKDVPAPSEADLQKLFEEYREELPGQSEPYGFGYKLPDRLKLEYLVIPLADIIKTIVIDEADALAYYNQNSGDFLDTPNDMSAGVPEGGFKTKPYSAVRDQIIARLTREKATEKARRLIQEAASILEKDRNLKTEADGPYRKLPAGFQPTPLREVADQIQKESGIRPEVHIALETWYDITDLTELPRIGRSVLPSDTGRPYPFAYYALSARELEPEADNPLVALKLQVGLASRPLQAMDGSQILFRITEASATHVPQSLDAVREAVEKDARTLAAYEEIVGALDRWTTLAADTGMAGLAGDVGAKVLEIEDVSRRTTGFAGGLMPPPLPGFTGGMGEERKMVIDAVFDQVQALHGKVDGAAVADRMVLVPLPASQRLAAVLINDFDAPSRSAYEARATQEGAQLGIRGEIEREIATEPLSLDALKKRLGWVSDRADEEEEPASDEADGAEQAS